MDTRTPDIRFSCPQCEQRIVVDASAAGVEATCPRCATPVVIPGADGLVDRESVTASAGRRRGLGRASFPDVDGRSEGLERELSGSRAEVARLHEQLRVAQEERGTLEEAGRADRVARQQSAEDLELARERIRALETAVAALEARRGIVEEELAGARAEIRRLQDESALHVRREEEARARVATGEAAEERVRSLEEERLVMKDKLAAAIEDAIGIQLRCDELRVQAERAERELLQTESGRELAVLRERLAENEAERKRLTAALGEAQADLQRVTRSETEWRSQFELMRTQRDESVKKAEAGSQSALQHGNDILRGILDRQKVELGECYAELRQLRRARLGVRLLYALGFVLFLAAVAFGVRAIPVGWSWGR